MPVVSTEVLEILQGLGLDDDRALLAAKAVGDAQSALNDGTQAEVARLRGSVGKLHESVIAELKAAREETQAWVKSRAEQEAAFAALAREHRAAFAEQARAASAAAETQRKARTEVSEALGAFKWLLVALVALNLAAIVIALVV